MSGVILDTGPLVALGGARGGVVSPVSDLYIGFGFSGLPETR